MLNKYIYIIFIDVFLFPFEIWILRGIVLAQLLIILILITVIIVQCKKMKGLVLIDLSKKRAAKRKLKNVQSTRL